jgi:high-affinity K+ transport system ATPase subunit B
VGRPGRQDGGAAVRGEFFVRALQARLVAARHDHAALELIAHDGAGDAPKNAKARVWLAIQSGTCWVRVTSAYV